MKASEILDIQDVITRWDEIIDRTESGETFAISVEGKPVVRLEPIPLGEATSLSEEIQASGQESPLTESTTE